MLILAAVAMIAGGMSSCKKGENDGFLSLRSRKARVVGEWTMETFSDVTTISSGGASSTETVTMDGSALTITSVSGGSTTTTTGTVNSAAIDFSKDGTWTRTMDMTIPYEFGGVLIYTIQSVETSNGTWNFLGKVDEFKNKERMVLNTLSSTSVTTTTPTTGSSTTDTSSNTYADGESSEIMTLDELKNKKIVMLKDENNVNTPSGGTATTTVSTVSMTLTR